MKKMYFAILLFVFSLPLFAQEVRFLYYDDEWYKLKIYSDNFSITFENINNFHSIGDEEMVKRFYSEVLGKCIEWDNTARENGIPNYSKVINARIICDFAYDSNFVKIDYFDTFECIITNYSVQLHGQYVPDFGPVLDIYLDEYIIRQIYDDLTVRINAAEKIKQEEGLIDEIFN